MIARLGPALFHGYFTRDCGLLEGSMRQPGPNPNLFKSTSTPSTSHRADVAGQDQPWCRRGLVGSRKLPCTLLENWLSALQKPACRAMHNLGSRCSLRCSDQPSSCDSMQVDRFFMDINRYMYVCIYIYTYIHTYIYTYTCVRTHLPGLPTHPPSEQGRHKVNDLETSGQLVHLPQRQRWRDFGFNSIHMGGCQNYGPFLGPNYNTAPNI